RSAQIRAFFEQQVEMNGETPGLDPYLRYLLDREGLLDARYKQPRVRPSQRDFLDSEKCPDVTTLVKEISRQVNGTLDAEACMERINEGTMDEVLRLLAALELEDLVADLPELPLDYSVHGAMGEYLASLNPKLRERAVRAVTPFLTCIKSIRVALATGEGVVYVDTGILGETHNAEELQETEVTSSGETVVRVYRQGGGEWFKLDKLEKAQYLKTFLYDLTVVTGNPEKKYVVVDLEHIAEIIEGIRTEFVLSNQSIEGLRIDIMTYLFTGKSSKNLDKPRKNRSDVHLMPRLDPAGDKKLTTIRAYLEEDSGFTDIRAVEGVPLEYIILEADNSSESIRGIDNMNIGALFQLKLKHPKHPVLSKLKFLSLGVDLGNIDDFDQAQGIRPFDIPAATFNQAVLNLVEDGPQGPAKNLKSRWNRVIAQANECVSRKVLIQGVLVADHLLERFDQGPNKPRQIRDEHMMKLFFESITTLNHQELEQILSILFREGVKVIPEEVISVISERFRMPRDILDRFNASGETYDLQALDYLPRSFHEYTDPVGMLSMGTDDLGMGEQAKEVLALLAERDEVLVQDRTAYDYPKGGRFVTAQDRLVRAMAKAVVTGDCPEALRNCTILEFQNGALMQRKLLEAQYGESLVQTAQATGAMEKSTLTEGDIKDMLQRVVNYNDNCVLIVRPASEFGESQGEFEAYLESILQYIADFNIKVLVMSSQSGLELPKIAIERESQDELYDRFMKEKVKIETALRIKIPDQAVKHLAYELKHACETNQDPIDVGVRVLNSAAIQARSAGRTEMQMSDMVGACNFTFGRLTHDEEAAVIRDVKRTRISIGEHLAGQTASIDRLMGLMQAHFTGLTNVNTPLTIMMPGPTGVGKTLTWEIIEKENGIPVLVLKGSEFQEKTSVNILRGSDPGYEGDSEGKLTKFLEDKMYSVVFLDEYEKFHKSVIEFLMEFIDKGRVQSGAGKVYWRPRTIIAAATNAGQSSMNPGMNEAALRKLLTQEIAKGKPEIIARWREIIPYHALEACDLHEAIANAVENMPRLKPKLGKLGITTTADEAFLQLAFEQCREICAFRSISDGIRGFAQAQESAANDRFVNMRGMNSVVDRLVTPLLLNMELEEGKTLNFSIGDSGSPIILA
ncbi:MAG TPA: AAA family ATPase, partial [Candidatus Gracilibacteria bacterium]